MKYVVPSELLPSIHDECQSVTFYPAGQLWLLSVLCLYFFVTPSDSRGGQVDIPSPGLVQRHQQLLHRLHITVNPWLWELGGLQVHHRLQELAQVSPLRRNRGNRKRGSFLIHYNRNCSSYWTPFSPMLGSAQSMQLPLTKSIQGRWIHGQVWDLRASLPLAGEHRAGLLPGVLEIWVPEKGVPQPGMCMQMTIPTNQFYILLFSSQNTQFKCRVVRYTILHKQYQRPTMKGVDVRTWFICNY